MVGVGNDSTKHMSMKSTSESAAVGNAKDVRDTLMYNPHTRAKDSIPPASRRCLAFRGSTSHHATDVYKSWYTKLGGLCHPVGKCGNCIE